MAKVGIFGGTFDPPHLEHVNMVAEMVDGMMPDQGLVQLIAEHGDDAAFAVGQYVKDMKQAVAQ